MKVLKSCLYGNASNFWQISGPMGYHNVNYRGLINLMIAHNWVQFHTLNQQYLYLLISDENFKISNLYFSVSRCCVFPVGSGWSAVVWSRLLCWQCLRGSLYPLLHSPIDPLFRRVVWNFSTFENNFAVNDNFTKYLKESCGLEFN